MFDEVRVRGLWQVVGASVLFAVFVAIGYWLNSLGWHHLPWEFSIPAGYMLAGLLQMITGVPFTEFAARWDSLKAWQRGIVGVGIVLASGALFIAAALAYITSQGGL